MMPIRCLLPLVILIMLCLAVIHPLPCEAQSIQYIVNGYTVPTINNYSRISDLKMIENYDSQYNRYTDNANGFSISYPADMAVDYSISSVRTTFSNVNTKIEVYYDNFTNTISNAQEYIYYGNRFADNDRDHTIIAKDTYYVNGLETHILKWNRRKLSRLENDKNYYFSAEIVKNDQEVYTVIIKSSQPIENEYDILNSFQLIAMQGEPHNYRPQQSSISQLNPETIAFYKQYFGVDSKLTWGIFEPSAPETFSYLIPLEEKLNYTFPILLRYQSLEENVPLRGLEKAFTNKRFLELTLQTVKPGIVNALLADNSQPNASIIYDILDGQYDAYLTQYAEQLRVYDHPVLFRFNNEMNGDWCWYSAYYTCKDADLYIALWKYIHTIFAANDVKNVLWVWNPHDVSRPDFKWNHYLAYYPGDEYVDVIGLTGYNTGTYFPGESWREFEQIYQPLYSDYCANFNKPFMITEFGSNSVGGNKVEWIQRMFDNIAKYDRIKVAIWWSGIDYDLNNQPGRIYLLDESDETTNVFRTNLANHKLSVGAIQ